jgi:transposase InsO family protein
MKKEVLDRCIARTMRCKDGAFLLKMHPKAFSRLKKRYLLFGEDALVPKKPGPKNCHAVNRTPEQIEEIVERLAIQRPDLGPVPLTEKLEELYSITMDQTTVWRILKRRKVRYATTYKRWKQDPTLYCLDQPGIELQMDGCYPYGRSRPVVVFDAIDDCSRWVYGLIYEHEDADSAIDFVKHLIVHAPFRICVIRVDNRYGKRFVSFCESIGIRVIENDAYTPKQNGKIERFHKTIKREFFWRYCAYNDPSPILQMKLTSWLQWYNTERRHGGYGMNRQTPTQKIASTMLQSLTLIHPQKVTGTLQQYRL